MCEWNTEITPKSMLDNQNSLRLTVLTNKKYAKFGVYKCSQNCQISLLLVQY